MDNRQSFEKQATSDFSGLPGLVQAPGRECLFGRRYEHIPVRLAEAIHGFRYSRKGIPDPALQLNCGPLILVAVSSKFGVRVWGAFPEMSEAMDGRREAHMGEANALEAKLRMQRRDSNL
ncbi:MAG: hypothetical protein GYB26_10590 [Gammaproteobacteria bacterium]|nr:hypothetical protein [Gammaproteobacteria bacterium]